MALGNGAQSPPSVLLLVVCSQDDSGRTVVVNQRGTLNPCGWIVIILAVVLVIVGASLLGAGLGKAANTCADMSDKYENNGYNWDVNTPQYQSCIDSAARLVLWGIILLIAGAIDSCVACCACGGVTCFRKYDQVVSTNSVYLAGVPQQQQQVWTQQPNQTNQGYVLPQPSQQQQQWQQQPQGYPSTAPQGYVASAPQQQTGYAQV